MSQENLPKKLLEKHLPALGLINPLYIEDDRALFQKREALAESAVIFLPKSRALINMTLALTSGMVIEGGTIVLAGTNDAGIRSAKESYESNIGPVREKIVGSHSALYVGTNARLGAGKKIESFVSYFPLSYGDVSIEVANLPGVFSAGELDEGTKLLLDAIPYDKKRVLDIGCGAGVIGAVYLKKNPKAEVSMCDVSSIAVLAAQKTCQKNELKAAVFESDVFEKVTGAFGLILTNPPFHTGVDTDYSFIDVFAKGVKKHLAPGGQAFVVANAFLPYQEILEKHIGLTTIALETKKFKVYRTVAI